MPITINWLLDKQVMQVTISGDVYARDFDEVSNSVLTMLNSAQVPLVHIVCDDTQLTNLYATLPQLSGALQWLQHQKFGWVLCYGSQDRMATFLAKAVATMFKLRYRRFKSEDDALDFLASIDTSFRAVV